MGFENIIFVMEDVDAASPIVQSRDRSKRKKRGTKTTVKVPVLFTLPSLPTYVRRRVIACRLVFTRFWFR